MLVEGFVLLLTVMFHLWGGPCVENNINIYIYIYIYIFAKYTYGEYIYMANVYMLIALRCIHTVLRTYRTSRTQVLRR